jgi:putative flippase GtrA
MSSTSQVTKKKEVTRFLRFAVVGSLGAVVDFGIFNLLVGLVNIPAVIASMVSFICAVINNFTWNRFWTYPDSRGKSIGKQILQFFIINIIGLGIRTPLFAWLEKILISFFGSTIPETFIFSPTFLGHNISLAIVILIVMMWNFFANRYWTYNDIK